MNETHKTWVFLVLKNAADITKVNLCWVPDGKGTSGSRK